MPYYKEEIIQTQPLGNNALSHEQRKILGSSCELFVPDLIKGDRDDLKVSTHIGFEEVDHKGQLQSCYGLEKLVEIKDNKIPTYIIDNHNHALYLRYREYFAKRLGAGALLIHIDQHADMGVPETPIDTAKCTNIDYVSSYTNEVCNVGNFIQPAMDSGLVSDVVQIRSVSKLLEYGGNLELETRNYILDIDIDFRSDHMPTQEEITAVKKLYSEASICTIALSPYFMDTPKAIKTAKMLFAG